MRRTGLRGSPDVSAPARGDWIAGRRPDGIAVAGHRVTMTHGLGRSFPQDSGEISAQPAPGGTIGAGRFQRGLRQVLRQSRLVFHSQALQRFKLSLSHRRRGAKRSRIGYLADWALPSAQVVRCQRLPGILPGARRRRLQGMAGRASGPNTSPPFGEVGRHVDLCRFIDAASSLKNTTTASLRF